MTIVASFEIGFSRYLDPKGQTTQPLPDFAQNPESLIPLYGSMVLTRTFDAKAIALQRTGRLGTFGSSLGQEAVGVGVGAAMRPEDVLFPTFREAGAQLLRGVTLTEMFLFWGGDERGNDFQGPREDFPICVPIAAHVPHAVGAALAFRIRRQPRVACCVVGDGATSKGDFYEALNAAGVWRLPILFVIANNQWAISVPRGAQTAAETLAQKGIAAGIPSEQVDGNDVIAVRHAVGRALDAIRAGGRPRLIEAITYRLGDHTTADDASRYRDDAEVSEHWKEDPVARLRLHLTNAGVWAKKDEEALLAQCAREVDAAADAYLAMPPQPVETMFDYLYETLPKDLEEQRAAAVARTRKEGTAHA